jgi:DNA-binding transcriptional MerR regulator
MPTNESDSGRKRHPIQVVARRTGLTADVLRAWEKRYGVVEPGRSEGGRRLYSDDDIERLRLLRRASAAGRRISQIARLSRRQLVDLVQEDEREEAVTEIEPAPGEAMAVELLNAAVAAAGRLAGRELEAVLNRALVTLGASTLIEHVLAPLMVKLGEGWEHGSLRPAHEHLASTIVMRVLGKIIDSAEPAGGAPKLVVATPSHQLHEFGALFAAAVSIVYQTSVREVEEEVRKLRRHLPADIPVFIGGAGARDMSETLEDMGATHVASLSDFRSALAELTE